MKKKKLLKPKHKAEQDKVLLYITEGPAGNSCGWGCFASGVGNNCGNNCGGGCK